MKCILPDRHSVARVRYSVSETPARKAGARDTVCEVHSLVVRIEWHGGVEPLFIILVLLLVSDINGLSQNRLAEDHALECVKAG